MNYINKKEYRATGGNRALLNDYHRRSDSLAQWQINFLPYKDQQYGFDYLGSGNHGIFSDSEYYPYLSANYDLRYKSIECYKTDKVIVDFGSYPEKDSVIFKDKYGVQYKLADGNILNFTGVSKADTNYIYAYRGDQKLGKLSVNTYKQKIYKVVLVSVNKATLPDINELKEYLGKIYRQCVDTFEIETDTLSVNNLFPFSHGDKNRFSGYNDDQKRVLKAYDSRIKPDINYLFFIPDGAETNGVAGYNPLGYNFGFIYFGAGNRTIAHELAHGIASLNHPFKDEVETKGQTDNLLDYNDGTSLWHFQWDNLQNPPSRIFKWNFEEEDAESIALDNVKYFAFDFFYNQLDFGRNLVYYRLESQKTNYSNRSEYKNGKLNCYPGIIVYSQNIPYVEINGEAHPIDIKDTIIFQRNFVNKELFASITIAWNSNFVIFQNQSNSICLLKFDFIPEIELDLLSDIVSDNILHRQCTCGNENEYVNKDEIFDILKELSQIAHDNQDFQFVAGNGKAYRLNGDSVEESNLSDEDILNGNFSGKDLIVRYYKSNGNWQVSAMGISKDVPIADGKTADVEEVSKEMLDATRRYFDKYHTENFETPMTFANTGHLPSGGDIKVDDDASIFSVIAEGGKMTVTFLKTAEFEQKHYLEHTTEQTLISMPGECSGALEGGATAVTDITSLVGMGYDLVVDEESRDAFVQGFSALADEVKDDPVQLFPLLGNIILSGVTGLTSDEYKEMVSDDTDPGRAGHLAVKCVASTAITTIEIVFTAGATKSAKIAQSVSTEAVKTANKGGRFSKILAQKGYRKNKRTIDLREKINSEFFVDFKQKFFDDFDNISYDDFEKLVREPELIESWKKLSKMDCMDGIRNDVTFLEKISKFENVNFDNISNVFTHDVKDEIVTFIKKSDNLTESQLKILVGDCSDLINKTDGKHFKKLIDFEKEFDFLKGNPMQPKIMKSVSITFVKGLAKERVKDFISGCLQEMVSHYLIWLGEEYSKWIFVDGYKPKGYFEAKFATTDKIIEYCENVRKNGLDNVLSLNSKKKLSVYNIIGLLYDCISATKWDDYINLLDIYGKEKEMEEWLDNWETNCAINTLLGLLSDSINNKKAKSEVIEFLKPYLNNTIKDFTNDKLKAFFDHSNEQ